MLKNYIITAVRNFKRYKGYTFINILGLTVGSVCSLLILLWVNDELSVDKFHENKDRLYQVMRNMHLTDGQILTTEAVPQPMEITLEEEYPEVRQVTLLGWPMEFLVQKDKKVFREEGRYVSPEFLQMFSFPLLYGDPATALNDMHSMVITRGMAEKYFGTSQNAMGKTLKINNTQDFMVTGVLKNITPRSSLQFDCLLPAKEYISRNDWVESWFNGGFRMMITLNDNGNARQLAFKIEQEINENTDYAADERLFIRKFSDSYLYSTYENGVNTGGRIEYVRILAIIAVFIIVIACINVMNLATARASRRALEIGLRKVMGANKGGLRIQFFIESLVMSFTAIILAVLVTAVLLPFFSEFTGKSMELDFSRPEFWLLTGSITIVTGILSGSYPALLLPSFNVINSMKGTVKHSVSAVLFRKGLVVFQFILSVLLIIGALTVNNQLEYIMNKNLGLDKENLVYVVMEGETAERFETYRSELLKIPEVSRVTATSGNPLNYGRSSSSPTWRGKDPDMTVEMNILMVASDFLETFKMKLIAGRTFSENYNMDSANYIINEEAARIMGFEDPVGKDLSVWGIEGQIIGMVMDFHMSTMYEPIEPLVIRYDPGNTALTFIRLAGNPQNALKSIERITKSFNPSFPFRYWFLDQEYASQYKSEQTIRALVSTFAFIAIFISCLGLLGLSSYLAELRTREISIRKVFGADIPKIVMLLVKDYTILIFIALIIATPVAWYVANSWLERFAYRVSLNLDVFLIAGIFTVAIAFLTIGYKSLQAALTNPAKVLKEEG